VETLFIYSCIYVFLILCVAWVFCCLYVLLAIIVSICKSLGKYLITRRGKICFFHKWSKWEQYEVESPGHRLFNNWSICTTMELRQYRKCENCGKTEDILITQFEVD
jgi:hypothetical protein